MGFAEHLFFTDQETGVEFSIGFNNAYGVRFTIDGAGDFVLTGDQAQELQDALDAFLLDGVAGLLPDTEN